MKTGEFSLGLNEIMKTAEFIQRLCASQGSDISTTRVKKVLRSVYNGKPKVGPLVGLLNFDLEGTTLIVNIHGLIIHLAVPQYTVRIELPEQLNALSVPALRKVRAALLTCSGYSSGTDADELVVEGHNACDVLLQDPGKAEVDAEPATVLA